MKRLKKILRWFLLILLVLVLVGEILVFATGNTYINRTLAFTIFRGKTGPDIDDLPLFENTPVVHGQPQYWPLSADYNSSKISDSSLARMKGYETVSFLVIRRDSLLFESYWNGYNEKGLANSFSMAKSINAALIGCALREGLIRSIDEPVGTFLPEFATGEKSKITIKHLLTMSSGLDFKEDYASLFAWPAAAYYGPDVNAITVNAQPVKAPGTQFYYKGGDSQLLGMILKKVTGKSVAAYATEKLWKPLGAEADAFWSLDDRGMEKVSCCFYASARDFARIAKLYMNKGSWNGKQILDSAFVEESLRVAPLPDKDGKPNEKYGYQWWMMHHRGHPIFYMRGILGQYVFAIPDMNLIVVRLGHKRDPVKVNDMPIDIYLYLDVAMGMANE